MHIFFASYIGIMTCISCAMLRYQLVRDKSIHLAFAHCFYCPVLLILYVQPVVELSYPDGCSVKSEKSQNLAETFLLWTPTVSTLKYGALS